MINFVPLDVTTVNMRHSFLIYPKTPVITGQNLMLVSEVFKVSRNEDDHSS